MASGLSVLGSLAKRGAQAVGIAVLVFFVFAMSLQPAGLLARWEPSGAWHVPYFAVMAVLVATGVGSLLSRRLSAWMTESRNVGSRHPHWFLAWVALNVIILATAMFATLVWLLYSSGTVDLTPAPGREVNRGAVLDFYIWHSFEFVPFLEINDTLRWREPVGYTSGWVGATLLAYKAGIVVPIILAFRSARRERERQRAPERETTAQANTVMSPEQR